MEGVRVSREWGCHNLTPNTKRIDTLSPQDQVFPRHIHLQSTHKAHVSRCLVPFLSGETESQKLRISQEEYKSQNFSSRAFSEKRFVLYCEMN